MEEREVNVSCLLEELFLLFDGLLLTPGGAGRAGGLLSGVATTTTIVNMWLAVSIISAMSAAQVAWVVTVVHRHLSRSSGADATGIATFQCPMPSAAQCPGPRALWLNPKQVAVPQRIAPVSLQ